MGAFLALVGSRPLLGSFRALHRFVRLELRSWPELRHKVDFDRVGASVGTVLDQDLLRIARGLARQLVLLAGVGVRGGGCDLFELRAARRHEGHLYLTGV